MARTINPKSDELRAKMRELKDSGLLPNGYAKKILEILLEKGIANFKKQ